MRRIRNRKEGEINEKNRRENYETNDARQRDEQECGSRKMTMK